MVYLYYYDTEIFWQQLKNKAVDFERKEPLKFALIKNRFRTVEQSIGAKNFWTHLKKLKSITGTYSKTDIEKIDRIITDDENRRIEILKKCLSKKTIPKHTI